ncbi:MAG: TetR family transcriptional regulator, partial [Hyphomicrobiales bacterium]
MIATLPNAIASASPKAIASVPGKARPLTRIQREKQDIILEAALEVFSAHGFRGSTIDQIAEVAGMSKP